jgi:CheY-like chemotaxis protein
MLKESYMCSASESGPILRRTAVLCVDDSQNMLLICRTILEASGYEVVTASSGKAGLAALEQHPIDVVVLDNRMPGMTGTELAHEIKQSYKDLPIVMFSDSYSEPSLGSVDLFLNKKQGPRALRDAVVSLLATRPRA